MKIELDDVPFVERFLSDILLKAIREKAKVNLTDLYINNLDISTFKEGNIPDSIVANINVSAVIPKKEVTKLLKEAIKK